MKKHLLILMLLLGISALTNAQGHDETEAGRVQALKIAFITQRLQLTSAEAEKFWPVYNQYEREIRELRTERSEDPLENEEKLLNIRKKYKTSFEKILGPQKLNQLYNAERDFRTILIKQLKNRNQGRFRDN